MNLSHELEIACLAVQRASLLTSQVFDEKSKGTSSKHDLSPVTIGDYGAQALIIKALKSCFPDDAIVAEEEAGRLREDAKLSGQVWDLVRETRLNDAESNEALGGNIASEEEMLKMIDYGDHAGGPNGRIWTIDPIDGTKGFIRGGQYAVCLALIVNGIVQVGVLGCPNLPSDITIPIDPHVDLSVERDPHIKRGVLVYAVLHQGARIRPLETGRLSLQIEKIEMNKVTDTSEAIICEGVESSHSSHHDQAVIAKELGIKKSRLQMDSQAKYASIARGAGDIYLRLPARQGYKEKIWDHAPGDLITREAGGAVTDAYGNSLDFGRGRTLDTNIGIVAASKSLHPMVLDVLSRTWSGGPNH